MSPEDKAFPEHKAAQRVSFARTIQRADGGSPATSDVSALMTTPPREFDADVAVVGGGSAGYAAASTAAAAGLRTVLIDGSRELGGLCILRGCMPSKALLWAAEVRHLARRASDFGMEGQSLPFNWESVMAWKNGLIAEFADYRQQQLTQGQFTLIRAHARFVDPHTVELGTGRRLAAKSFVLATGSIIPKPPLPQLAKIGAISSDDLIHLKSLPRSILIVGGGAIAVEFAQLVARFDVNVTVIQRSDHLLSGLDYDLTEALARAFESEGIQLFTGTELLDAREDPDGKWVVFTHRAKRVELRADAVLVALGRTANTSTLGLEAAGVTTDRGRILTDSEMRTSVPHIFAAGDCTGPYELVHIAVQQGDIAAQNIIDPRNPRRLDLRLLTEVIFTDPQIAVAGLGEREALRRNLPVLVARHRFDDHGKSLIMGARHGFVKLLADPANGEILGGGCVGPLAGELIHEIIVAMAGRMRVQQLALLPHYHPTLAEIWTYPAEELTRRIPASQ
jgi:pyruvate/2-oxoglutarate dehydrogenase complex dihydrolipoamide dehydrogenase (E3) component